MKSAVCLVCFFLFLYVDGRPIDKRSLDLSSLKDQAIKYIKGIPARWREFIPDEVYQKGMQKYKQIKGFLEHFFEGDIAGIGIGGQGNQQAVLADASTLADHQKYLWPGGVVPYDVSNAFADHEKEVIQNALDDMSKKTCIKFVRRTNEPDYISFMRRALGCSSYVGRQGSRQFVDLQPGCIYEIGEVQHETMHAIGFYHEQSRTDRDDHVSIVWDNVKPDQRDQFKKYVSNTFGLPYDYESIMHYGWNYFAIDDSKPTILPKMKAAIGNRKVMSALDVERINKMYNCPQAGQGMVNIPTAWSAKTELNPDWRPVVTPAPGSDTATKCFLKQNNDPQTTTQASGLTGWLFQKFKNVAKDKAKDVVCGVING
ncbi:hatching enzyme 1.2-like [Paramacrobiotus metropolitanus]|uniref:hatching enzyme 1.2-like n=1 Tax=Paramacrobiotus metropolitanus TaxID=2943436 RepID=UPI0024464C53|nr:hatching enzyme 1.2-like [Paramacrobiotus metropolitanus]